MTQEMILNNVGILAKAELDTMITTAKAYPRDIAKSMKNAEFLATMDEETAQSCFYVLPRKEKDGSKKEIKGASIRLAEIMLTSWGNIHGGTRIVENDGKQITAEAVCWDLEANVKIATQNKVSIRFGEKDGKGGYVANNDMQTVLSNAASAKALRNAIFKVVPKALVDRILQKAMTFSIGDQKTLNTKANEVIDKLVKMGINKELMFEYYECKGIADITPDILRQLIGVGTAIKEGHIKVDEVFKAEKDSTDNMSASEKINLLLADKKTGELNAKG